MFENFCSNCVDGKYDEENATKHARRYISYLMGFIRKKTNIGGSKFASNEGYFVLTRERLKKHLVPWKHATEISEISTQAPHSLLAIISAHSRQVLQVYRPEVELITSTWY